MKEELLRRLRPFGQEHLVAFWDALDSSQRASLAEQIGQLDFELLAQLYQRRDDLGDVRSLVERALPPPAFRLDASKNRFTPEEARQRAVTALRAGEVGVLLVAGGQGTRLGFDHPKGMFPIGPISGRTLFQIHVEKIVAASRRYGVAIPLYVMTSPATHEETVAFFAANERFGLPAEDFHVFCQGTMPAVDLAAGRVLLDAPGRIALSPDGHGGMLAALGRSGALKEAQGRGIRHWFYLQVDNPLVDICGQEFLGYHLLSGSQMSTQVVAKTDPLERVGNVVQVDGRLMVIEYSDLPDDLARRRAEDGSLQLWAGSIAVHVIETALLERTAERAEGLPFHIARKKVPYIDPAGQRVEPTRTNAIKFERFIFDLIPFAERAIVVEVDPPEAFAPLKNAPGAERDTPAWVQAQMIALHRRWLQAAGVELSNDCPVEISPLWAMDADQVAQRRPAGLRFAGPSYLC